MSSLGKKKPDFLLTVSDCAFAMQVMACNKSGVLMFRVIVASWVSRGAFGRGRFHHGALKGEVSLQL